MNRARLVHRADIARSVRSNVEGKTVATAPAVVATDVACWAEGIGPQQRALVFGRRESARYVLTWMDDLFRNEDLVSVRTLNPRRLLGTFVLRAVQYDVQGGYWIGTLEEHAP